MRVKLLFTMIMLSAMLAARATTATAQCPTGNGFGVGGINFEELACAGQINYMPPGGDGGLPPATMNLAVFEDSQYVGTRAIVRFDKFHVASGEETFKLSQQRTRDNLWQTAGIYNIGKSKWHPSHIPPHSVTPVKVFMDVPGTSWTRASRSFLVRDSSISTVGMYLRLSARSACAIQNYRNFGIPPYCTPSAVYWEFNYWANTEGNTECFQTYTAGLAAQPIQNYSPIGGAIHGLAEAEIGSPPPEPQCRSYVHLHTFGHASYFWDCVNCLDFCEGPRPCPTGCRSPGDLEASEVRWCEGDNIMPWPHVSSAETEEVDVYDPQLYLQTGSNNDPTQPIYDICRGLVPGTPCILCPDCPSPAFQPNLAIGPFDCTASVPLRWTLYAAEEDDFNAWKLAIIDALTEWAEAAGNQYSDLFEFDASAAPSLSSQSGVRITFYVLTTNAEVTAYEALYPLPEGELVSEDGPAYTVRNENNTTDACGDTELYGTASRVVFDARDTIFSDMKRFVYELVSDPPPDGPQTLVYIQLPRKRVLMHEIGHVLGFADYDHNECSGDLTDEETMCQVDKDELTHPGVQTVYGTQESISEVEKLTLRCMIGKFETYCGPF